MLYRKISTDIETHLRSGNDKIMVVEGARQIGKSYIIREVGNQLYKNFVEVNFVKDDEEDGLFQVKTSNHTRHLTNSWQTRSITFHRA